MPSPPDVKARLYLQYDCLTGHVLCTGYSGDVPSLFTNVPGLGEITITLTTGISDGGITKATIEFPETAYKQIYPIINTNPGPQTDLKNST